MANNIVLKTYRGGNVTPQNDAIIYQTAISANGIFKGCQITYAGGNRLHISQGFGMIKGRFFEVYECEVGVTLNSASGTLLGRLYIHMDLSNGDEPIQILTVTGAELPVLEFDEDINYNNTVYDLELATFQVTRTGITNLEATFAYITNATGSGGELQRETEYQKGDFVTCKSTPGWVTLCCTKTGVTAASEPAEYSGITKIGDTVQDGTCVFTARDIIGELDALQLASVAAEEDIKALKEELIKQSGTLAMPIGTVRFTATPEKGWLLCDGKYISATDYPELVQMLGKQLPGDDEFRLLSSGEIPYQISNGAVYAGRMWVFSYSAWKLYGIDLSGKESVKIVSMTSSNTHFRSFLPPSTANPIALSIVPHHATSGAKLFLAQIISSGTDRTLPAKYSWMENLLLFSSEFSGSENSLTMEPPFTSINLVNYNFDNRKGSYLPTFDPSAYVPYVVSHMEAGVEKYYCMFGCRYLSISGSPSSSSTYGGACTWIDGNAADLISVAVKPNDSITYQRFSYSKKNSGESVCVSKSTNSGLYSSSYYYIYSVPVGLFSVDNASVYGTSYSSGRSSYLPLAVAGESKVLLPFDKNRFPWVSVTNAGTAGDVTPNLSLPDSAKIFVDAGAYLWSKEIFLIFVGTGIIFSHDLTSGSFGYLDTTSVLGNITQFGYLDYSEDESELYIMGQDSRNKVKCAKIILHELFDYASDGAWLPRIASSGLPAYIKAKN